MALASAAVLVGLVLVAWSAERFVEGASAAARHFRVPPLVIGMVVVGFGTSAPELVVSGLAAWQDQAGIALGNAYGSNIANIALILGLTALTRPIAVQSRVLRKELPLLIAVTALAGWQVANGLITRVDALVLLGAFAAIMLWVIRQGLSARSDALGVEMARELEAQALPLGAALARIGVGLVVLVASSRLLVWGAVEIALGLGISELVIGLTIVAAGTSLPELASALSAARKNEHDLALGNVLGSNLFNTLLVVGIAAVIRPIDVSPEVLYRDTALMGALTLSLFVFGYGFKGPGRINRLEGAVLLAAYVAYTAYLVRSVFGA